MKIEWSDVNVRWDGVPPEVRRDTADIGSIAAEIGTRVVPMANEGGGYDVAIVPVKPNGLRAHLPA